ncbi:DEAD/DEAH box helicase [Kitasatospora sp. Root107]|nr:DEAD/DEAH box helicase [Kitasatospora sp. Root107]
MRTASGESRRQQALLECWRAIELFSPPTIPKASRARAARAGAATEQVCDLTPAAGRSRPLLPWAETNPVTAAHRAPRGMMWRHEVYGGIFELEQLRQAMIAVLPEGTDPDPGVPAEELVLNGQSAMFALVLDERGHLIEDTSVVSACAWATGRLFDPGPSTPGWLDGFEELSEAFALAVDELTAIPIAYGVPTGGAEPGVRPSVGDRQPAAEQGADGASAAAGWQQLLAEILGGAAVGAVGALFGEVAGAALQGAAEPLIRRAADWAAARRAARDDQPAMAPPGIPPEPGDRPTVEQPGDQGPGAGPRPLAFADLVALTAQIADLCGVQRHLDPTTIRVRSLLVHRPKDPKAQVTAAQPFLNSLLPPDLARVRGALGEGLGPALDSYLTSYDAIDTARRTNLREERAVVLAGVGPALVPAGRWPAKAEHPLALSQQFAVNRMLADLDGGRGGLFSVNGPPGTGKTTMLRDLVAALVVERATVLADFDRPEDAFTGRPWVGRDRQGAHPRFVSALDPRLTGFEIVVTSSNNGAVENITAELPGADALAATWRTDADHFADLASALLKGAPAWGLVAAVLGNKSNRREFGDRFWWGRLPDKETAVRAAAGSAPLRGMQAVLSDWIPPRIPAAAGAARGRRTSAAPTVVGTAPPSGPVGSVEAVPSWPQAVAAFRAARAEVERLRTRRTELAAALADVESPRAGQQVEALRAAVQRCGERVAAAEIRLRSTVAATASAGAVTATTQAAHRAVGERVPLARQALAAARADLSVARELAGQQRELVDAATARHEAPAVVENGLRGGLRRFLQTAAERQAAEQQRERSQDEILRMLVGYRAELAAALADVARRVRTEALAIDLHGQCVTALADVAADLATARSREEAARAQETAAHSALLRSRREEDAARRAVDAAVTELNSRQRLLREAATELPALPLDWLHLDERDQELGSPWSDEDWNTARSDLFMRALDLHRAFVAGAAKKVRGNLQVLMELMAGSNGPVPDEEVQRAWQTLFLLVPVISTTFSSIGSMFARLGRESIGWVLVDEAGQATPQAAVGALWRARRAVLVGDPLQLEPVVTMPAALQHRLLRAHGVDEEWLPSATSAQAVADRVNRYGTYLPAPGGGGDEYVWVGSPLRVHRRCQEPMFTVSNEVAYDGLMVYGTHPQPFPDAERDGLLPSRWLDTEDAARPSDAPWGDRDRGAFGFVLDQLDRQGVDLERLRIIAPFRALVAEARSICRTRGGWTDTLLDERCATVHKAQGKEADVVILLLGGGRPGAREWAARTPHLLNVAASRAKRRLYVIGERRLWAPLLHFDVLATELEVFDHRRDGDTWPPRPSDPDQEDDQRP